MKTLDRRQFSRGAASALLLASMARRARAAGKRPNVLLVMADEWRYQSTGYAGDPNARTPFIDRFAAESLDFDNAIAGCSVCCPSRASVMTGQHPLTHGVYINDVQLKPKSTTLAEAFAKAGYDTGYIGKWHLYGSPDGNYGRREAYIPADSRLGFQYWKAAEVTHDYNKSFYYEGDDHTKKYWSGYDAIAQTADACQYIRARAKGTKPYFLMLSWGPPHAPLQTAPSRYREMYRDREIILRPNVPEELAAKATDDLRGYYAHIAALDDCFKQLLDALEASGTANDTIVMFTADHGYMLRSQGLMYKLYPWEESIRVPMLVRYPRRFGRTGRKSRALISSPDVMPTLLGLSGIEPPSGMQGVDFSRTAPARSAFLNLPVPITSAMTYGVAEYRGVRTLRHTYVRSIEGPWLLYDNQRDPFQKRNLCGQKPFARIQARLEEELQAWLRALGDGFLPAGEYLQRDGLTHYLETKYPVRHTRSPWDDWESILPPSPALSVDSVLGDLLDQPAARAIVLRALPGIENYRATDRHSLRLIGLMEEDARVTHTLLLSLESQLSAIRPRS